MSYTLRVTANFNSGLEWDMDERDFETLDELKEGVGAAIEFVYATSEPQPSSFLFVVVPH